MIHECSISFCRLRNVCFFPCPPIFILPVSSHGRMRFQLSLQGLLLLLIHGYLFILQYIGNKFEKPRRFRKYILSMISINFCSLTSCIIFSFARLETLFSCWSFSSRSLLCSFSFALACVLKSIKLACDCFNVSLSS